jgi:hypothetical protein
MNIKSPRKASQSQPHIIRHINYIYGNSKERRELELKSMGPLTHQDAINICQYLQKLAGKYFINKPDHIKSKLFGNI